MTARRRRTTALAGSALVIALALTGCGGSGHDASDTRKGGGSSGTSNGQNGSRGNGGSQSSPVQPGPNGGTTGPDADGWPAPPEDDDGEGTRDDAMTDPRTDARSTFALDVDTGSYTRFRDAVAQGQGVARDEIRTEEFVNYFRQDYEAPPDGARRQHRRRRPALPPEPPDRAGRHRQRRRLRPRAPRRRPRPRRRLLGLDATRPARWRRRRPRCAPSTAPCAAPTGSRWSATRPRPRVTLEPTPVAERDRVLGAIDGSRPRPRRTPRQGLALGYDVAARMRSREGADDARRPRQRRRRQRRRDQHAGGILERIGTAPGRASTSSRSASASRATTTSCSSSSPTAATAGTSTSTASEEAERVFATGLTELARRHRPGRQGPGRVRPGAGRRLPPHRLREPRRRRRRLPERRGRRRRGVRRPGRRPPSTTSSCGRAPGATPSCRRPCATSTTGRAGGAQRRLADAECAEDLGETSPRLHQDLVIAMLTDHLVGGPWSQWVGRHLRDGGGRLPDSSTATADVAELVEPRRPRHRLTRREGRRPAPGR